MVKMRDLCTGVKRFQNDPETNGLEFSGAARFHLDIGNDTFFCEVEILCQRSMEEDNVVSEEYYVGPEIEIWGPISVCNKVTPELIKQFEDEIITRHKAYRVTMEKRNWK
jgi:hypothetical protein